MCFSRMSMSSKTTLLAPGPLIRLVREATAIASSFMQPLKAPLQFLSFWGAIGLPIGQVSLLVAGLESAAAVATFAILLVLNVVTLYVGHGYKQRDEGEGSGASTRP